MQSKLKEVVQIWDDPRWSALIAFVVYTCLALLRGPVFESSRHPYFNYLADAFLHGQLSLRLIPPGYTNDLVMYKHMVYLYWPPMPAILLMPFVAMFGVGFSDILFTLILAAVNVGLVSVLLREACVRGLVRLTRFQRALLVLFFSFGTVYVTLAPLGRVWFTAQIVGFFFTVLAFYIPLRYSGWRAFLYSGVAIACAALTRNHLLFAGIWPAYFLLANHFRQGTKKLLLYCVLGMIPLIMAGVAYFGYNWLRFGSILDVGLDYHTMAPIFEEDYQRYGAFHLHYLPKNFYYQYLAYPLPLRQDTLMGGSLFLLSPVFFGLFFGIFLWKPRLSSAMMVLTILTVDIPILLLMGTGWVQFGPRYSLDFTVPMLFLTARGIRRWSDMLLALLVSISIIHYLGGYVILLKLGL